MQVDEEVSDMIPREYGFFADNDPPFVNAAGDVYPNIYPVIRIENVS